MADVESIEKEPEEVKKRLATVIAKYRAPVEPSHFRTKGEKVTKIVRTER
jgi:hypothetical protein